MTTYRISNPNHKAAPVAPFAAEVLNQSTITESIMQQDNNSTTIVPFASEQARRQARFWAGKFIGMIATRIAKISAGKFVHAPSVEAQEHFEEYGMYPAGSKEECQYEIRQAVESFNWAMQVSCTDDVKSIIEAKLLEWTGGGFASKVKEEAIAGWMAQGMTREAAIEEAARGIARTRDYLAVKRERMGSIMHEHVLNTLARFQAKEPAPEVVREILQKAYEGAYLFGNHAEMILVRGDFADNLGESPVIPERDEAMELKAKQIREKLADRVEAQAQKELEDLRNFNINDLAA